MTENELGFDWADLALRLMPVVEQILQGYCLCRLIKPFLESKGKAWRIGAVYFLTMMLLYGMGFHPGSSTAVSIGILAALAAMCLADRRNYEQKIFLSMALYAICWLASAIAEILYDNLNSFAAHTDYMAAHPRLWGALCVALSGAYILLKIPIALAGIG